MGKRISIAEASTKLPSLVREAESGRAIELTRRGEGVAVLCGRKQYKQLISRSRRFSDAWEDFRREVDLIDLAIEPDDVFGTGRIRDQGSGIGGPDLRSLIPDP